MVYRKYLRRGKKVFGPYYYESYRDGNEVKKVYIGGEKEYKIWLGKKKHHGKNPQKNSPKKNSFLIKILSILFLVALFFGLGLNLGYFFNVSTLHLTGFAVSGNVSGNGSRATANLLYGNYEEERIVEQFDREIDLEIKEPPKFAGEAISKNKNNRMEFDIQGGKLRLYFDMMDYNRFAGSLVKKEKKSGPVKIEESTLYSEVELPESEKESGEQETNDSLADLEETNKSESETEESDVNETEEAEAEESTEQADESAEESNNSAGSEPDSGGQGITGGAIKKITGFFVKGFLTGKAVSGEISSQAPGDIKKVMERLSKEELKAIEENSVVKADDFEIVIDEEKARQENEGYKWGYKVKLTDLNFMAKIKITSDREISVWNDDTLRIGDNLLSFSDLAEEGYTVRIEKPALNIEAEGLKSEDKETGEKEAEETDEAKDNEASVAEEGEINESEEAGAGEQSAEEESEEQEESETESGITGNIIKRITGFAIEDNFIKDIDYGNSINVYVERDFTGTGHSIGDIITLDPTLLTITVGATSLGVDYITREDNVTITASASTDVSGGNVSTFIDFDDSLVSWWRMDDLNSSGGVVDYLGRNNGTPVGNAIQNAGYMGSGFKFDGNGDYISLKDDSSLKIATKTISLWARDEGDCSLGFCFLFSLGYNNYYIRLDDSDNLIVSWFNSSNNQKTLVKNHDFGAGWFHLVVVWNVSGNNVNVSVYKNSELLVNVTNSEGYGSTYGTAPEIGRYYGLGDITSFNGTIDDVMLFNRSLSVNEIQALYANASSKYLSETYAMAEERNYTFTAYAQDTAGDVNSSGEITIIRDVTVPAVTINSPENTTYEDLSIIFNVSSSEAGTGSLVSNLDSSLVGWWRMDDNNGSANSVTDYLGVNNGTAIGDAVRTDAGYFGKGFSFDGAGDYIITDSNIGITGSQDRTISLWFKKLNPGVSGAALGWGTSPAHTACNVFIEATPNTVQVGIQDGNRLWNWNPDTNWHHLVITLNGTRTSDLTAYLDGSAMTINNTNDQLFETVDAPLIIGAMHSLISNFNGEIDDVMVFNKSLTADEILALYNASAINHAENLSYGSHSYTAYSQDRAGNVGSESVGFSITLDATPPNVTIASPENTTYEDLSIIFNVSSSEAGTGSLVSNLDSSLVGWWRMDDFEDDELTVNSDFDEEGNWSTGADCWINTEDSWMNCYIEYCSSDYFYQEVNITSGKTYEINIDVAGWDSTSTYSYFTVYIGGNYVSAVYYDDESWPATISLRATAGSYNNLVEIEVYEDGCGGGDYTNPYFDSVSVKGLKVIDYTGKNNGTAIGDAAQTDTGYFGKGFSFDGAGDYIITDSNIGISGSQDRAISLWFKKDVANADTCLLSWGTTAVHTGVDVYTSAVPNTVQLGIADGNRLWNWNPDTNWHHLVITLNGTRTSNLTAYLDGSAMTINNTNDQLFETVDSKLYIGTKTNFNHLFAGKIDDVMVFNRSLTADEILALYNATAIYHAENLTEGSHSYTAYSQDLVGNVGSESVIFNIELDTTPPSVTVNYPANESYNASSINFNITAVDDKGVSSCWYTLDNGITNQTMTNTTSASIYNHTNSSIPDGSYTARFYCNDTNNNINNTESVGFLIDTVYPAWSNNNTNLTASTPKGESVYFNITLAESNPDTYVFSWYNGTDWENTTGSYSNEEEVSVIKTINIDEGTINWTWHINDTAGNLNSTPTQTIALDTVAPLVDYGEGTLNDSSRVWQTNVYVNVSVTETNFKNITFNLYYLNNTLINSTTYETGDYSINWTDLGGDDYKYNVSACDAINNCNSTSTRSITLITSQSNITLHSGWNLISLPMKNTDSGTDRNVSLVAGWNLIGYSGAINTSLSNARFTNASGDSYTWANAVANSKVQAYLSYLDTQATDSESKYKYVAPFTGLDDTSLRANKGYWLYANQSGNLTMPSAGGTLSGETYPWSKLRFSNGTTELNITEAGDAGWIVEVIKGWDSPGLDPFGEPLPMTWIDISGIPGDEKNIASYEGIFVYSHKDNLTLIRQN